MKKEVLIQEESLEELLKENEDCINWLLEIGGEAAKDAYVNRLSAMLAKAPRAGAYATVNMCQLGAARFYPYTYSSRNKLGIADPINLVLTGRAAVIAIVKAGRRELATKLSPIADVYLRLVREHGCLLLYGIKPRTGLYAVEMDVSKGHPLPELTRIV